MAITFVQANGASGQGGGAISFTFAITTPLIAGNIAFIALGYTDNGIVPTTVVDNLGNTFALLKRALASSRGTDLWWCTGVAAGASTVTVTFTSGKSGVGICALEYAPTVGQTFTLDQQNNASNAAAVTSFPHGSITTTVAVELILTVGRLNQSITVAAGYTARNNLVGSNSVTVMERITAATLTTNPTPTGAIATAYGAMVVSLYEIADGSIVQETQQHRKVLEVEADVPVFLTQLHRKVLYPFTCVPGPTPPDEGSAGCPALPPVLPVTGDPGCADEV